MRQKLSAKLIPLFNKWGYHLNLSRHIATHLAGEDHTDSHRRVAGLLIMVLGIAIVKVGTVISHHMLVVDVITEVIGYGAHGIGLIPFASKIEKESKTVLKK